MHRNPVVLGTLVLGLVILADSAAAQSATAEGSGDAKAVTRAVEATAEADARAAADLTATRARLEQIAAKVPAKAKAAADTKLEAAARKVDGAAAKAEGKVIERLSSELAVEAKVLVEQQAALGASWGELLIAHSLEQNAAAEWTVEQLVALHDDGMGWGRIAAGLGLELGSAVRAVDHEARVALGAARADGRVQAMSGAGARIDARGATSGSLGAGGVAAGAGSAVSAAGAGAGLGVSSGIGVRVGR